MIATDFTRDDCLLGDKRVTYEALKREYRCNECGGRITTLYELAGWQPACACCGKRDFIHESQYRREQTDAREVLEDLPPDLAAALKGENDAS